MSDENRGMQKWRPKARLIRIIGDEIVSSPKVAILELVKNGYDADAGIVTIRVMKGREQEELHILDDGCGMSKDTVLNQWMVPGTELKLHQTRTPGGRRVLGEKGIGRFASARLGKRIELVTRQAGAEEIVVNVDWEAFMDDARFLEDMAVEWMSRAPEVFVGDRHGTTLRITDIRFEWKTIQEELTTSLRRLVSPFNTETLTHFRVLLDTYGTSRELEPTETIKKPHYTMKGVVRADGSYEAEIKTPAGVQMEARRLEAAKEGKLLAGPFSLEFRVWDREPDLLRPLGKVEQVRADLDSACGISIYRDGFRVLPYGEKDDDWLGLGLRSRITPGLRIANNQVVGVIEIGADNNPCLTDQSNREGIRETAAYSNLKDAVKELLSKLEFERWKSKLRPTTPTPRPADPLEPFRLDAIRSTIRQRYPKDQALHKAVDEKAGQLLQEAKHYRQVLSHFARLATIGLIVDTILHEWGSPLSSIRNEETLGTLDAARWPDPYKHEATERFRRIDEQCEALAGRLKKAEPFGTRARGRPERLPLERLIKRAAGLYAEELRRAGIQVQLPDSETIVTVDAGEIQSVFANFFDNSLYWLQRQEPPRLIRVEVEREIDGALAIMFCDNGPGVTKEDQSYIFQPYFTRKKDGTGLGLSIAGLIVQDYYSGSLELVGDGPLPGANFRVVLRRRVG